MQNDTRSTSTRPELERERPAGCADDGPMVTVDRSAELHAELVDLIGVDDVGRVTAVMVELAELGDEGAARWLESRRLAGVPVEYEDQAPLQLGDGYTVNVEDGLVVLRCHGEFETAATAVQWRNALQLLAEGDR